MLNIIGVDFVSETNARRPAPITKSYGPLWFVAGFGWELVTNVMSCIENRSVLRRRRPQSPG